MPIIIKNLLLGKIKQLGDAAHSAIDKQPAAGEQHVTFTGLFGNEQQDTRHHGGVDKALHHYPFDHYYYCRDVLSSTEVASVLAAPGAFCENISTLGMTEDTVMIGDRYRLGTAVVEVSQARQPCWKLAFRFGTKDMPQQVQHTLHTGWYYRVLEAGRVCTGDAIVLLERPYPDWPLTRLLRVLFHNTLDRDELPAMSALRCLPESWKNLIEKRLRTGKVEDWQSRIVPPSV